MIQGLLNESSLSFVREAEMAEHNYKLESSRPVVPHTLVLETKTSRKRKDLISVGANQKSSCNNARDILIGGSLIGG